MLGQTVLMNNPAIRCKKIEHQNFEKLRCSNNTQTEFDGPINSCYRKGNKKILFCKENK